MTREILFRAKRIDNGEQIKGNLIRNTDNCFIAEPVEFSNIGYCLDCDRPYIDQFDVDPETVCQYTGLHDNTKWEQLSKNEQEEFLSEWNFKKDRKNLKEDWKGRKIFDGDIVKHYNDTIHSEKFDIGVISWDESYKGFRRTTNTGDGFYRVDSDCMYEVVGNIFDNPEIAEEITKGNEVEE